MNSLEAAGLIAVIFLTSVGLCTCIYLVREGVRHVSKLQETGRLESEAAIRDRILERSAR